VSEGADRLGQGARGALRRPWVLAGLGLLCLLGLAVVVVAGLITVTAIRAAVSDGHREQGTVVVEIRNDLGVRVRMAVCEDSACDAPADGGGDILPGQSFPQATDPNEQQTFLVKGVPASVPLGSPTGADSDRCVVLTTGATVQPEYLLSSLDACPS
jgi:hypothetical protein